MSKQSSWLTSVTGGMISRPEQQTRDALIQQWLDAAAQRIGDARQSGDDAVVKAAVSAYMELCEAVLRMADDEQGRAFGGQ